LDYLGSLYSVLVATRRNWEQPYLSTRDTTMLTKSKIVFVMTILLGVAAALSVTTVALAETPEQRQACIGDAFQFYQSAIPNRKRVFACLTNNRDLISAACHTVPVPYPREDRQPRSKSMGTGKPL